MRIVWLIIVILVIAWTLFNNFMSGLGVTSALQASQLADQISSTMLVLIALTLAFWFVADQSPEAAKSAPVGPEVRPGAPVAEPTRTKTCPHCGAEIAAEAVRCRACGDVQPS